MKNHLAILTALLVAAGSAYQQAQAQPSRGAAAQPRAIAAQRPERAIRHDIPMTNVIRRALGAGSRDSTGRPNAKYWQLRTDYTISASLDPATQTLTGRETIRLTNNSPDVLNSVGMRLDHNIFRAGAPVATPSRPSETTDGMVITRLAVNGQEVNLAAPPGGRGGGGGGGRAGRGGGGGGGGADQAAQPTITGLTSTNARINLPGALGIASKATATIDIEWRTKIPGGAGSGHRMTQRWADTLFQPTQWFPRVSVYDDLRGWDPELYLGPSEFYNNFGRFDVRIDVPAGWLVGATGVLQNPQEVLTPTARARLARVLESDSAVTIVGPEEIGPGQATAAGNRLTWHFVADTVNDFAWATAKKYVWLATRATIPTRGAIPVHMFYLPGRAQLFASRGALTRHALEFYSKLWMPYEFPQLTMLDGPSNGMEYPMVINSNDGPADHETAHQWWPMMVSNNETWYGFMDEGFNQYMNILSDADAARQSATAALDGEGQSYGAQRSGNESETPMMTNANYAGPNYSFQVYQKTPLMLSMLGGVVGDSAVWSAMSDFAKAWRYKHPSPWDYMFFMNNALRKDLGWFWNYWLFTTESVDGSIQGVTTTGSRTAVTVRQDGQMPSPVVLRVQLAATGAAIRPMSNSVMVDAVTYDVTFPVDVWFGGSKTYVANLDFGGRAIQRITLDPRRRFPDRTAADNVWPRAAPGGQ